MTTCSRLVLSFVAVSSFLLPPSTFLRADGGAIRLSEKQGGYRITVFTTPTPVRAGPVDISVLVQDAATGEVEPDVRVAIRVTRSGHPDSAVHRPATKDEATNKLYYAAAFDLTKPGWYSVAVCLDGALGVAQVGFEAEAADPLPPWLTVWPWVGWPVLVILLFGMHQLLVRRASR
jgi:hypothetical protein